MNTKIERVKTHWHENKQVYKGVMIGVGVTAVTAVLLNRKGFNGVQINWKSPGAENIMQTVLERKGHPGYVVRCIETGKKFASQGEAARDTGVSAALMSSHLNGKVATVAGKTFERLGEATI
jgi:hypothetical protein